MDEASQRLLSIGLVGLGLAHELNSPLTTTALGLELLIDRLSGPTPLPTEAVVAELQATLARVQRMGDLVKRLRGLAQGSPGRHTVVVLDDLVTQAIARARPAVGELASVDIVQGDRVPTARVEGDEVLLEHAVACLIINAVDALKERDGQVGRVRVSVQQGIEECSVVVEDDGPGFPDPEAPITPGQSTKGAGGMGVGLALTALIAQDAGAALSRRNLDEGGAAVTLRFVSAIVPSGD